MATENRGKQSSRSGGSGGSWMKDVEMKVSQAIAIGVRSSGKKKTRRYRMEFYRAQLTKAKLEVHYYEEMLRLEEQNDEGKGPYDDECQFLEGQLRVLRLRERVKEWTDAAIGAGSGEKATMQTRNGNKEDGEASSVWTEGQETPVTSVKDEDEGRENGEETWVR